MRFYPELEQAILAFLARPLEAVGRPLLLRAVNNAKDHLQRVLDLEMAWQTVSLALTGPVDLFSLSMPLKRLCLAKDEQNRPVPLYTRQNYESLRDAHTERPALVLTGTQLTVEPDKFLPLTVTLYGVRWLPDFYCFEGTVQGVGTPFCGFTLDVPPPFPQEAFLPHGVVLVKSSGFYTTFDARYVTYQKDTNTYWLYPQSAANLRRGDAVYVIQQSFLLSYCFDYLLYRGLQELNFFLKEDERVMLSEALPARALEAIQAWNSTLVNSSVDVSLS